LFSPFHVEHRRPIKRVDKPQQTIDGDSDAVLYQKGFKRRRLVDTLVNEPHWQAKAFGRSGGGQSERQ
jgi:hypothetical protein